MSEGQGTIAAAIGAEAVPFLRFRAVQGWAGSPPVLGLVPEAALDGVLSRETMVQAFGRLALFEDDAGRAYYLGTWGRRRVARFLALLRARGLALRVVDAPAPPAGLRQRWRSVCRVPAGSVPAEAVELHRGWWLLLDMLDERQPVRGAEASLGAA